MNATKYKVTLNLTREEYRVMHLALDTLRIRNRNLVNSKLPIVEGTAQQLGREDSLCTLIKSKLTSAFTIAFGRNGTVK